MSRIKTIIGDYFYNRHYFNIFEKNIDETKMLDNLRLLSIHLNKIGINWGPAFGTLLGIVRNDSFLPWANNICLYILKEDEERFKGELWNISQDGFEMYRYERRGMYYIVRNDQIIRIFVLRKISHDVRHSGGTDFIHEKYIQNRTDWNFKGIDLKIPSDVDEYLTFQYGDWIEPVVYKNRHIKYFQRISAIFTQFISDTLPSPIYYRLMILKRKKDFQKYKDLCLKNNRLLPDNVELTYIKPRKHKKILTVGVYDLIHKGHVELFRKAKSLGDSLTVCVQDGDWVTRYKECQLLNTTAERCFMVASIRYVDNVEVYTDVYDTIKNLDFDVFVTGPDQCHEGFKNAITWCLEHGKEHVVIGRTEGISSSELKAKIALKKQK